LIYPGLPAADEREYISAMADHIDARSVTIDPRGAASETYLTHVERYRDFPDAVHGEPLLLPLVERAKADGVRVMLTGAGGDLWLAGNVFSLALLLRCGRWLRLRREIQAARADTSWSEIGATMLLPNLPEVAKRALRPVTDSMKRPAWSSRDFARRIDLMDRLRAGGRRGVGATPVVRESVARFWSGGMAYAADRMARSAAWLGVDLRHPFLDRRVVETVMTLPDDQRAVEGLTKIVLRRAMGPRLPALVRERRTKADTTDLLPDAIRCLEPDRLIADLEVARAGWVDGRAAAALLDSMRRSQKAGTPDYPGMAALWRILSAEVWLRHEQALAGAAVR
jgi:asparagine synthase (glutamine-hydrolysing)